jgi:hypothetical protein
MDTIKAADSLQGVNTHETMGSHFDNDKDANINFRTIFDPKEGQDMKILDEEYENNRKHLEETFDKQDFVCTNFHDSDNSIKMIDNY